MGPPSGSSPTGSSPALAQARAAAGDNNNVLVAGGANVAQQSLNAELLDEIQIRLVPTLVGDSVRLLDDLVVEQVKLKIARVIHSPAVTHPTYRVLN